MISSILPKQTQYQTLVISQSTYYTSPNHPSSEDELKWIDVSYAQSLVKEDVIPQTLNSMDGG